MNANAISKALNQFHGSKKDEQADYIVTVPVNNHETTEILIEKASKPSAN
jgi:hypothetical protein